MKKRLWLMITILIVALIAGLLIWRFWPQSASRILSVDEESITSFSSNITISRIENGQTATETYSINKMDFPCAEPGELLEILATSTYRQDFRNLLPWKTHYIEADKNYDGRSVLMAFSVGNGKDEWIQIHFLTSTMIAVHKGGEDGLRVYYPTNRETLDELTEYFQTHGSKQ